MLKKNKNKFIKNKKGATAIEYALIAALIALAIIGAMTTLGDTMRTRFEELSKTIAGSTESADGDGDNANSGDDSANTGGDTPDAPSA